MEKWTCTICGYVYDPKEGDPDDHIPSETSWHDLPADWVCPLCAAPRDDFVVVKEYD